ncbi:GDSL esterase/lipase At5g62930 [Magnolia sinica]|uniref:GDSL esterase/lipase At5g62930 n=1 Tax=Magnolia sinica TaxID=86752 RepID=UPI0026583A2D|nr:GDSL esterase/lipase At5g62930 [Magnolia sinica]
MGAALVDTYSRKADVMVRGYDGYNTRWALFLLNQLFPLSCTKPPVAVTIFFGANDAALLGRTYERLHVPVEEYKDNLRKIVRQLKECSRTMLVVLITPPPVDENGRKEYARFDTFPHFNHYGEQAAELPERTNEMAGVYAKQCVEVAKELVLPSVDLWSKMQETVGWQKKFLSDGLHLTEEGNAVVHREVVRVFNEACLCGPEMPYDFPHHFEIDAENPAKAFQRLLRSECKILNEVLLRFHCFVSFFPFFRVEACLEDNGQWPSFDDLQLA